MVVPHTTQRRGTSPSMKVPPKRKGNSIHRTVYRHATSALNESPSEKEGKYHRPRRGAKRVDPSMKVPPKRKGNPQTATTSPGAKVPSMKVPPKRKGNRSLFPAV